MGISLIGNSPCKIASEILCLSESSFSQQPAKAAGPRASPGAASVAFCQPDLVVKLVKPPQCLPLQELDCFPAAFSCCHPGPKAPLCRRSMRGAGCFPSLGKEAASLPADLLRKTQWCLGLGEVFFGQNAVLGSPRPWEST